MARISVPTGRPTALPKGQPSFPLTGEGHEHGTLELHGAPLPRRLPFQVDYPDSTGLPRVSMLAALDEAGTPGVVRLELLATDTAPRVEPWHLQLVAPKVDLLARWAYLLWSGAPVEVTGPDGELRGRQLDTAERLALSAGMEKRQRARVDSAFLERVAQVYKQAAEEGEDPAQAVRFHVDLGRGHVHEVTARKWVSAARKAGLLPPTTPGKKRDR